MGIVLDIATAVILAAALCAAWMGRRAVSGTEMIPAWWSALASLVAAAAVFGVARLGIASTELCGHLWYGVAILLLTPLVFALGARQPIARAWPWFVVLPMVTVLAIPSLSLLWRSGTGVPLQLESPTLVGMALVAVMGAGNYLLTRFRGPAALHVTGIVLLVSPWTSHGDGGTATVPTAVGLTLVGLAFPLAVLIGRTVDTNASPHQRVWADFRDTFGGLWAKRVMDRVNWTAAEEKWPARLELTGLAWSTEDVSEEDRRRTLERFEQLVRWLLKRFVDDRWLEGRFQKSA